MRRTLLAVGFAVLVSMLFAPHGEKTGVIRGWGPFFSDSGFSAQNFAYWRIGRVMIDMLAVQTAFLAVLFAVLVNIRWRWPGKKNRKRTSTTNTPNVAELPQSPPPRSCVSATESKAPKNRRVLGMVIVVAFGVILICLGAVSVRNRHDGITHAAASPSVSSPYSGAANFATHARKLREQELAKVEPQLFVPTSSRVPVQGYPWKMNIVTTVFWIGKKANYRSVWDANWTSNYGGTDTPDSSARQNYIPIAFIPRQNPFYCALPYNDVTHGQFKPEAPLVIPWFKQSYSGSGQSVCRHRWIAIRKGNRVCYAQWEDCGPFRTDHFQYVFGNERPTPNSNHGAGLNVSPAVRDYLGLAPTDVVDWQFVEVRDVPPGPWRSYGDNNHFVLARRQIEQRRMMESIAPTPSASP